MFWNSYTVPPIEGEYIVTVKDAHRPMILTYEGNGLWTDGFTDYEVIAWLPLPPAYDPVKGSLNCGTNYSPP